LAPAQVTWTLGTSLQTTCPENYLPLRDAAHDSLVMEIIQLISNLEVARCWVVNSVSALRA